MMEHAWLECAHLPPMFRVLEKGISKRKLRLFCCACLRLVWASLTDESHMHATEFAEKFADGLVDDRALEGASTRIMYHYYRPTDAEEASLNVTLPDRIFDREIALATANRALRVMHAMKLPHPDQAQCRLLRHLIGNPFHVYPRPESWPTAVVQLANALYNGQDCGFALHDALLEADHPELAEHFHKEPWHPKGCWVLDLLLGKD